MINYCEEEDKRILFAIIAAGLIALFIIGMLTGRGLTQREALRHGIGGYDIKNSSWVWRMVDHTNLPPAVATVTTEGE